MTEKINAPIGCDYLRQFMPELPVNCLFDKGRTGCGGTTIALTNEKDTIIAMPFVSIIKNKIQQAKGDKKQDYPHKLFGVYAGVTEQDILDYVSSNQTKKIMVTYDSLERLIDTLQNAGIDVYNDCYLLIDEWHILFNSYAFRNTAIKKVLRYCVQFKEVTYMTATPIEEEFILEELEHLPIQKVEWQNTVPVNVIPIQTNSPVNAVCAQIKDKLADKIFGNLHFFVNSVEFIAQAIKKSGLQPEQVRVICSENNDNRNQTKLGKEYPIASINSTVKPINFYTSACFEGCDIYDTEGKTYIVSDKYKSHTLLDISTLIIQICGRIRDSKYKTEITHIFNNTRYKDISFEDFKENTNKERIKSLEYINEINHLSQASRTKTITLIEKGGGLNEKYVKIDNNLLVFDENLVKVDIMNYKIANQVYQSRVTLGNEYQKNGFIHQQGEYINYPSDKLKKNNDAKISFKSLFIEYAMLKASEPMMFNFGNFDERVFLIEQEKPLVKTAYDKLGTDRVKALKYNVSNIKNELLKQQTDISTDMKIIACLEEKNVKVGGWKTCKEIKTILQDIYTLLGIEKAAKATDISRWFEIGLKSRKINGKTTDGYILKANKYIFYGNI